MGFLEIGLIGIGLAMDAFAVSICKGLAIKQLDIKKVFKISTYFAIFQSIMPIIGFLLGNFFNNTVEKINNWISFIVLVVIGINMIRESFTENPEETNNNIDIKTMILLAIATSIDALAVGMTFAFLKTNILIASFIIGVITLILCSIGVKIGHKFGDRFNSKAGVLGALILIFIGLKILCNNFIF